MTATTAPATSASALPAVLGRFFETKTSCDVAGTMSYFSPSLASYIDATLGWDFGSYDALKAVFEQYMPGWEPPAPFLRHPDPGRRHERSGPHDRHPRAVRR